MAVFCTFGREEHGERSSANVARIAHRYLFLFIDIIIVPSCSETVLYVRTDTS